MPFLSGIIKSTNFVLHKKTFGLSVSCPSVNLVLSLVPVRETCAVASLIVYECRPCPEWLSVRPSVEASPSV